MKLLEPLHIKKIVPKPLRLNIVLFFIATVLLGAVIPLRGSSQSQITFERFSEQMLKQRDVDHVTTYKSGDLLVAEVFLKRESLNKGDYADAKKTDKSIFPAGDNSTPPQYVFTAATYDGLAKAVYDAETRFGYKDADRISVGIEAGHEGVLTNWVVQCIIMIFLLILLALCGYLGYKSGKNRIIGSIPGLLLGFVLGPVGLIIVYVTEKKPLQKNGGIRV